MDLSPWLTGNNDTVSIRLNNQGCWGASVAMAITRNGSVMVHRSYAFGYGLNCGYTNLDWRYLVNTTTGQLKSTFCFNDTTDRAC